MKKPLFCFLPLLLMAGSLSAQEPTRDIMGIKTNLLYWGTTTPNLGMEIKLAPRATLAIDGMYNPFEFEQNKKLQLWAIQPEYRRWICEGAFNGHFIGIHAHFARYNIALNKFRNDGHLIGGGVSYGYQFVLGRSWRLEATLGVGYAYLDYRRFLRQYCGKYIDHQYKHYFGPTKVGISFVYIIH